MSERMAAKIDGPGLGNLLRGSMTRGQVALLLLLLLLTIGAWGLTLYQARTMGMPMGLSLPEAAPPASSATMEGMAGMSDAVPSEMEGMGEAGWSAAGLVTFVLIWSVMMTAMMLPAVTPMLLLYRTVAARQAKPEGFLRPPLVLAAGYVLVWSAGGVGVYALLRVSSDAASRLSPSERLTWAPLALGAVLVLAGLYQFTPLKQACLRQCQSPVGFLIGHWRAGRWGAARMGVVHGAYCVGCCWALFAVLVATGVMSIAWMLLLTVVVFAEKVLPYGQRTAVVVGLGFVTLGVLVATGVARLPWMT